LRTEAVRLVGGVWRLVFPWRSLSLARACVAFFSMIADLRPSEVACPSRSKSSRICSSSLSVSFSMPMKPFLALVTRISSSSLAWRAALSRFWVFWIRNTIRKVTMVVEVLITSCQVSEKPNTGPVIAHTPTAAMQRMKASGLPASLATPLAKRVKICVGSTTLQTDVVRRGCMAGGRP
jgi:hypothetical protein